MSTANGVPTWGTRISGAASRERCFRRMTLVISCLTSQGVLRLQCKIPTAALQHQMQCVDLVRVVATDVNNQAACSDDRPAVGMNVW